MILDQDDLETDISFEFEDDCFSSDGDDVAADQSESGQNSCTKLFPEKLSTNYNHKSFAINTFIEKQFIEDAQGLQSLFLRDFLVDETLIVLQYKNWLRLEVLSEYYGDWDKLRIACGLPDTRKLFNDVKKRSGFTCMVCCESGDLDVFSLLCGHEYCLLCYGMYVTNSIGPGILIRCMEPLCNLTLLHKDIVLLHSLLESSPPSLEKNQLMKLPDNDQSLPTTESDPSRDKPLANNTKNSAGVFHITPDLYFDVNDYFKQTSLDSNFAFDELSLLPIERNYLLNSPSLIQAARTFIGAAFDKYVWCPAPDCPAIVSIEKSELARSVDFNVSNNLSLIPVVSCFKSHEFCFQCRFENHLPCPCWLAKNWIKKCSDDSETIHWLQANTQTCPACSAVIEKNGGCNHMTCRKCKHEFCWICYGDWKLHNQNNWQCNRFDPEAIATKEKTKTKFKKSLSRYLHFYQRFAAHQISMVGDYKTLATIQGHMLEYMKHTVSNGLNTLSWSDVQFLIDSFKALCSGRKSLMWSYAFAFYLQSNNFSTIFESMQDFLSDTVEKLSQIFEDLKLRKPSIKSRDLIVQKRERFLNLTSLVLQRRRMLIEAAQAGLESGDLILSQD